MKIILIGFLIGYMFPGFVTVVLVLSFFTEWGTALAFFSPLIVLTPIMIHQHYCMKREMKEAERRSFIAG